jgi:xanthine dehydrogenase accessory factor
MNAADRATILEAMEAALEGGPPVAVATVTDAGAAGLLDIGAKLLVRGDRRMVGSLGAPAVDARAADAAVEAISAFPRVEVQTLYVSADGAVADRRHLAGEGDAQVMLQLFESPARLIVVGGGHIGLALAQIGELLGFRLTVLDDRTEFANRERFPMAEEVHAGELGAALDAIDLDGTCHVVLVSRGHRQDEEALRHSVGRGAAFVGMIGSRRRTATVLAHLLAAGFDRADLEAVSTPIGVDIGAETPEEIALSILAEIVMRRRGGNGELMVARRAPFD